jgi:endonuclease YncB( thermonuclease family)
LIRPFLLALVLLLAACGRDGGLDQLALGEQGRVREVVSGHYLELDSGLGVRLAGVVAPKDDEPHAAESLAELRKLVEGKEVRLLYGGLKRDSYDRAIPHVRVKRGEIWLQRELLEAGAVRVKTWSDNRALAREMYEAEARARNAKRGLWALTDYHVLLPRELDGHYDFQIVEGRVRRISQGDEDVTLIFDDGFTAYVTARAKPDFTAAGLSPGKLRGRLLRVRGLVREGGDGPEMKLDHPEQVEALKER